MPVEVRRSASHSALMPQTSELLPRDKDNAINNETSNPGGAASDAPALASPRTRDIVDSYLRQLYGDNPATRATAARGLGALPSFLPPGQASSALRLALELGVVSALTDVLSAAEEDQVVQEACLQALASLMVATAAYEDHAAPLRPPYLKELGSMLLRPEVVNQIGYLLTATSTSRVVLAAARFVAILSPYINQSNDQYILDSRLLPALQTAAATVPPAAGAASNPRDAAAAVLSLLSLAQSTPNLYLAICNCHFFQSIAVLYQRSNDPDQPTSALTPADVAGLLMRATTLEPPLRSGGRLSKKEIRTMEQNVEDCEVLECLVSYVAVEAANLRQLGEALAEAAERNAADVVAKNSSELKHLTERVRERQQHLAEARVSLATATHRVGQAVAEADAAGAVAARRGEGGRGGGGSVAEQMRAAREAREAAAAVEALVDARAAEGEVAEVVAALVSEVGAMRRGVAPLRWQRERMARLAKEMQAWREQHGAKAPPRVKISRPNTQMLEQVLSFLSARSSVPRPPKQAPGLRSPPPPSPSPEHAEAVHGKLLAAGLVQAMVRMASVLSSLRSLAGLLAGLLGELALQPDMEAALGGAGQVLAQEAEALGEINRKTEARLKTVDSELQRLSKSLDLGIPRGSPRQHVPLGPGNSLSRVVKAGDVEARMQALEVEAGELSAVLSDSQALLAVLEEKMQAVSTATSALGECHARFLSAFPAVATAATTNPATAASPSQSVSLASNHIMAKDPSHPAGHLLGLLSRALAPLTQGSSNLAALVRQLQGRLPPGAAAATWPPPPQSPSSPSLTPSPSSLLGALSLPAKLSVTADVSGALKEQARRNGSRPRSASVIRQSISVGNHECYGGEGGAAGGRVRPASARSNADRSNVAGGSGERNSGGPFPVDSVGRPLRYPQESMYGLIKATYSSFRSYSIPHNGPRRSLLQRPPSANNPNPANPSTTSVIDSLYPPRNPTDDNDTQLRGNPTGPTAAATANGGLIWEWMQSRPSSSSPSGDPAQVAEQSRLLVQQVRSSLLFRESMDTTTASMFLSVRPTSAMSQSQPQPQPLRESSLLATPRSVPQSPWSPVEIGRTLSAVSGEGSADSVGMGSGGAGGVCVSVLDALLAQSELLGQVMTSLATLQKFIRTTARVCRELPANVSFASVPPGRLGPFLAQLHTLWAEALRVHPEMRIKVGLAVTQIAELSLIPTANFAAVYRTSGMLNTLIHMMAGQLYKPSLIGAGAGAGSGAKQGNTKSAAIPGTDSEVSIPADANEEGAGGDAGGGEGIVVLKPRHVLRGRSHMPPTLRLGPVQQEEQAVAANALRAISHAQSDVLAALGEDTELLTRLGYLVLDHSMTWASRLAAAELLSDVVLGGGAAAEAAVAAGAFAALTEVVNRDMYPFLNQDPRGSKVSVVSALACVAGRPELLDIVLASASAPSGPSAGLPVFSPEQVLSIILRSLWGVCQQAYEMYTSSRTGYGRYVGPELVSALLSTAATAARELAVLAHANTDTRGIFKSELDLRRTISTSFLQAIKDPPLHEALVDLRQKL